MLRRTRWFIAAHAHAGGSSESHENRGSADEPLPSYDYMTLGSACSIFGYQMNERIEKKELKKRFNKLALKHHPDHGGDEKKFQTLLEAHQLLQNHRHDRRAPSEQRESHFHNVKPRHHETGGETEPNKANPFGTATDEHKRFDKTDVLMFLTVAVALTSYYLYHAFFIQSELQRKRGRLTESEMADPAKKMGPHDWHPWRATQEEYDQLNKIAVVQGSMREDVAAELEARKAGLAKSPLSHF